MHALLEDWFTNFTYEDLIVNKPGQFVPEYQPLLQLFVLPGLYLFRLFIIEIQEALMIVWYQQHASLLLTFQSITNE